MICEYCRKGPDDSACDECPIYCVEHQKTHTWFPDDKTTCLDCVDETVHKIGDKVATAWAKTLEEVRDPKKRTKISNVVMRYLVEVDGGVHGARLTSVDMVRILTSSNPMGLISRPIISYAQRHGRRLEEVVLLSMEQPKAVFLNPNA